jgi:hypothetical protein
MNIGINEESRIAMKSIGKCMHPNQDMLLISFWIYREVLIKSALSKKDWVSRLVHRCKREK